MWQQKSQSAKHTCIISTREFDSQFRVGSAELERFTGQVAPLLHEGNDAKP
jgi:hypothetical protein